MDPVLVVSPHLDDAVLSAGQFMAGRPDCYVASVFCGLPPDPDVLTDFDRHSGFSSAEEALRGRRAEDRAAMDVLRADFEHLPFCDYQYRADGRGGSAPLLADYLAEILGRLGARQLVGPLGLLHPDHVLAADACLEVADRQRGATEVWLYEDVPSRVVAPDTVGPALDRARAAGFDPVLGFIGTGPRELKARAVNCYRSQRWALDRACLYVPERFWRLWPR